MAKGRVELTDTTLDAIYKMSDGNPGAITFFCEILAKKDWKTPVPDGIIYLLTLDDMGLYGSEAYMLWNDCCNRNMDLFEVVLRNYQMGKMSAAVLFSHIRTPQGRGIPFTELVPLDELFKN